MQTSVTPERAAARSVSGSSLLPTGGEHQPPVSLGLAGSIAARIASHAAIAPDRPAILDGSTNISFAELERRSNQLAGYLRELGAAPDSCVGLLLDRSIDFVVAALAVMKSGAAYLPLDSSTPADRAEFILADAGASILLTHRGKAPVNPVAQGQRRVIQIDGAHAPEIASRSSAPSDFDPAPHSLAYVIYTSGSTGRPKGVEISHANLCNLIDWHQSAFHVTASDRASQVAGLGFDAAVWEIWPHLTAGASLHFADEMTRRSPQALRDWIVAEQITISFVPTVLAEQMLHAKWPHNTSLRFLLTGADTLHRRPSEHVPFVVVNNYGPTECTVVATSGTVSSSAEGAPTIGRAIANTSAFILDESLQPVGDGEAGELCLAGAHVGRGYRNNAALTAERFASYTPPNRSPVRIYRTGDRARWMENGEIAFLGRVDDQVKIRGYRVELGEIVAWLDKIPGVETSAVIVQDNDSVPELVAYIVAAEGARLSAADLRGFLGSRLPDYMIPTRYVSMAALPMTSNGKLDKSALPAPNHDNLMKSETSAAPASANADGYEQRIGDIVATLLGQPAVRLEDNFFMLGGHSMLGVQLVARIRDTFGVKLTLRQLFGAPTVAALSAEVSRLVAAK